MTILSTFIMYYAFMLLISIGVINKAPHLSIGQKILMLIFCPILIPIAIGIALVD